MKTLQLRAGMALAILLSSASLASAVYTALPSGYDGGGFCNVTAVHPDDRKYIISGHDAGGFHITTDAGATWVPSNAGKASANNGAMGQRSHLIVASIAFCPVALAGSSPINGRTVYPVYAAVGHGGSDQTDGGLLVSKDLGATWNFTGTSGTQPNFCGIGSPDSPGPNDNPADFDLPGDHPRSTGNLIAFDPTDSTGQTLYVATYKQGVLRSTNGGSTWTSLGLSGYYLRTLAISPDGSTLWAGAYQNHNGTHGGVLSLASPKGGGPYTWNSVSGAPVCTEELYFLGNKLWVVGATKRWWESGIQGVVMNLNSSNVFVNKLVIDSTTTGTSGSQSIAQGRGGCSFYSIDGYWNSATSSWVVFAGVWKGGSSAGGGASSGYQTLWRSTDTGSTWACISTASDYLESMVTPTGFGANWWLAQHKVDILPEGASYVSSMLLVAGNYLFTSGRSGVWRMTKSDSTTGWHPAVTAMNATFHSGIVADSHSVNGAAKGVYTGDADWAVVASADGMNLVDTIAPTTGGYGPSGTQSLEDQGFCLTLDPHSGSDILFAGLANQRANVAGNVYVNTDAIGTGTWFALGGSGNNLRDHTPGSNASADPNDAAGYAKRPLGIAVGVNPNSSRVVVLVAVQGAGIYRTTQLTSNYPSSTNWATWDHLTAPATGITDPSNAGDAPAIVAGLTDTTQKAGSFWWPAGSKFVYYLDKSNGLYRSSNYGSTWIQLSTGTLTSPFGGDNTGFITGTYDNTDPDDVSNHPHTLYLSHADGHLYGITNADKTSPGTPSTITFAASGDSFAPGPLVMSGGKLSIAAYGTPSGSGSAFQARLYQATTTANTSFSNLTPNDIDTGFYCGEAKWPRGLAIDANGNVYVSTQGQGVVVIDKH